MYLFSHTHGHTSAFIRASSCSCCSLACRLALSSCARFLSSSSFCLARFSKRALMLPVPLPAETRHIFTFSRRIMIQKTDHHRHSLFFESFNMDFEAFIGFLKLLMALVVSSTSSAAFLNCT